MDQNYKSIYNNVYDFQKSINNLHFLLAYRLIISYEKKKEKKGGRHKVFLFSVLIQYHVKYDFFFFIKELRLQQ